MDRMLQSRFSKRETGFFVSNVIYITAVAKMELKMEK